MYKPFRIRRAHDKDQNPIGFYLVVITENGRTILTSEVYVRKRACYANVRAIARLIFSGLPYDKIRNYIEGETRVKQTLLNPIS